MFYNKMIQKTLEVIKQFQAHQGAQLQIHSFNVIEKRPENAEVTIRSYNSGVQALLKDVFQNKITQIDQKLAENQIQADLDTYKEPGGKFQDYGEIDNVFGQGKTSLTHKEGEVLLVDVWATWCGPCQNPMKHNQEMLEKNEEVWGDKVRIIGVSVDKDKQVIQQRVTSKKWQKITHLTLLGWKNDHKLIQDFKIRGIPFICLVDKWGKINFTGHPSEINLETRINELLNEQQDSSTKPKTAPVNVPNPTNQNKETIDKVLNLITKENIEKEFKDVGLICFKSIKKQKYENGVLSSQLKINAHYVDQDQAAENLVKKLFDNHRGVTLKLNTVKYTPIPRVENHECSLCQAKDLQYPFYWLKWEEGNKFGCRTCVQKKSEVQGHHYAYEKNSVLLFGKWEKIGTKDLGGNLQPVDVTKVDKPHGFFCNGCSSGSEGVGYARYIALAVRCDPNFKSGGNLDLCEGCMSKLIAKEQGIIDSLLPEGHKDNHPFLRVLYNTNGYYEY